LLPPNSEPGAIEGGAGARVSAGCTVPGKRSIGAAGAAGPGAGARRAGGAISGTLRNSAGGGTVGVDDAGDAAGVDAGGTAAEELVAGVPVSADGSGGAGDGD